MLTLKLSLNKTGTPDELVVLLVAAVAAVKAGTAVVQEGLSVEVLPPSAAVVANITQRTLAKVKADGAAKAKAEAAKFAAKVKAEAKAKPKPIDARSVKSWTQLAADTIKAKAVAAKARK